MGLIRDYYDRFRVLLHEVAKFGIVGGVGFVVQFGVQNELHIGLGIGPTISVGAAFCVAAAVTFVGNKYWSFRHREGRGLGAEAVTFFVLNGVAFFIQEGLVDAVYYGLNLRDALTFNAATFVGIGIGTLFRLYTYRKFVFRARPAPVPAETAGDALTRP